MIGLAQHYEQSRLLNDFPRREVAVEIGHTMWKAAPARPIFVVILLALHIEPLRPRLHLNLNAVGTQIFKIFPGGSSPDSRKVRLSVGQFRRASSKVGFSISSSRNAWIWVVYPLGSGGKADHNVTNSL